MKIETTIVINTTTLPAPTVSALTKVKGVTKAVRDNSHTLRLVILRTLDPEAVMAELQAIIDAAPRRQAPEPRDVPPTQYATAKGLIGTLVKRRPVQGMGRVENKLLLRLDNGTLVEEWERKAERI